MNYDQIVSTKQSRIIHEDNLGTLLECDLGDDEKAARFYRGNVPDLTLGTTSALIRVPPHISTTKEAKIWIQQKEKL